ncbi:hypothetical protein VNO77_42448 [Canavalia gladiata]|uniref:Uncharacterized protein n=1 Tax=Canavalia gladiata TaxID=3824 RepID=A0AAN9JV90_CANGL
MLACSDFIEIFGLKVSQKALLVVLDNTGWNSFWQSVSRSGHIHGWNGSCFTLDTMGAFVIQSYQGAYQLRVPTFRRFVVGLSLLSVLPVI